MLYFKLMNTQRALKMLRKRIFHQQIKRKLQFFKDN